jgi:glucose/arabinose dehydrogenase
VPRLHTITANLPPVYFRGQAGLLDVALDRNFASNHRIFFVYMRIVDADNCVQAVDSATLKATEALGIGAERGG